jgi:hypothetical protein
LKADANHRVSTHIVNAHPHSLIGLEDLTDIRERTKRRKRRRKKNGKGTAKVSVKQRKSNATYSKWSFAELQSMIAYRNRTAAGRVDEPLKHHIFQGQRTKPGGIDLSEAAPALQTYKLTN